MKKDITTLNINSLTDGELIELLKKDSRYLLFIKNPSEAVYNSGFVPHYIIDPSEKVLNVIAKELDILPLKSVRYIKFLREITLINK